MLSETIASKQKGTARLIETEREIAEWLQGLEIDLCCLEGYAYSRSNQAHQIGELGGVIRRWLYLREIPVVVIPPANVKKFASGSGNADKDTVMMHVLKRWGVESVNSHEADAYVLARMGLCLLGHKEKLMQAQEQALEPSRVVWEGMQ